MKGSFETRRVDSILVRVFMQWMAVSSVITKFDWSGTEAGQGELTAHATLTPDDTDYKGTKKVTWLAVDPATNFKVTLVELDHLITERKVDEGLKVADVVNRNSYIT